MDTDVPIHLRVPAATKGLWIRASRAQDMRLSDWIIQAVQEHLARSLTRIRIPDDVKFADLHIARDADGSVSFDWSPIERICAASGIDIELLRRGPEENISGLIAQWYSAHREAGGAPDPVQEDLIAEVRAEESAGQHHSHAPARA